MDSVSISSLIPAALALSNILTPFLAISPLIGVLLLIGKKVLNDKKIDKFSNTINKSFIKEITLYNIIAIKLNAEKYNKTIEIFNSEYIKHFQTENEIDIDLISHI